MKFIILSESMKISIVKFRRYVLVMLWFFGNCGSGSRVKNVTSAVTRHIRSVGFPEGSGMGIFFAVGIPLDIPDKSVSLAFYFEANYGLPDAETLTFFGEHFRGKTLDRKIAYDIIQKKLESAGYPGEKCLLRAICEASTISVKNNGLIGDIIHIFFTPSSSEDENLSDDITNAEHGTECTNLYCDCPISLLDLISHFDKY